MRKYILFGPKPKYKTMNWWENFMSGHWNVGKRITIYGANGMDWVVNIRTKKRGIICFTLPSISKSRKKRGHHLYFSPNGTPWACTYYKGRNKEEKIRAQIRKMNFGHGFDTDEHGEALYALNHKFEWFKMTNYDVQKYGDKSNT